jgi:hypothetical protein
VSLPILLSGFGVAGVAAGGFLAVQSDRPGAPETVQTTAGLLLIAGFGCVGVALFFIFGPPG